RHWIIGTTDTDWTLDKAHPAASRADIDYLLDHVNAVLSVPLTRDDVEGVYAGLRPLLSGESDETSKLSREHVVAHPVPGLVMIAGGKYTTYRVMAKDAVDAVVHGLDQRVPPSCTDRITLAGGEGYQALWNSRHRLAYDSGLHVARIEHLLQRYGSLIDEVLALIEADPSLGKPLHGADDYLRAEIVYAATHEGARHLNDVLTRRTHISIETFHRGVAVAQEAAELLAGPLGWDDDQVKREVEYYTKRIEAERLSQEQDTDQEADAIRLGAPELVERGQVVHLDSFVRERPDLLADHHRALDAGLVPCGAARVLDRAGPGDLGVGDLQYEGAGPEAAVGVAAERDHGGAGLRPVEEGVRVPLGHRAGLLLDE